MVKKSLQNDQIRSEQGSKTRNELLIDHPLQLHYKLMNRLYNDTRMEF